MIKDPQALKEFENNFRREKLSYDKSLKIFESMWKEGVRLGVLPPKDDLEGIEVDIKVAAVLNSCLKKSWPE